MLLGKFHKTGISLLQHTQHVVEAGIALFGTAEQPTRLGECWLRFFKLPQSCWQRFYWNLLAAAWLHDWGKANDGMQSVLHGARDQVLRHEHFSALLIAHPTVWDWLSGNPHIDRAIVLSAVLTHHLQAGARADGFAHATPGAVVKLVDRSGQFTELVRQTGQHLALHSVLDTNSIPERWTVGKTPTDIRACRERIQNQLLAPLKRYTGEDSILLRTVRAALITADAAGSGYAREGHPIAQTVWKEFVERQPLTHEYIKRQVIKKRLEQITPKGKTFSWTQFQLACDNLPDRALLLAPCGSGKTLAAWRWIAAQCAVRPVSRVVFLYPTRATAKEGFRDYVSWAPESEAALMHGNAAFDLHGMFDNGDARGDGSNYEADRRLFALGYWPRSIFSATVDQFLGFLQHGYGSMCMLPVLADSVIVIDEVHSFDRHMFTALKAFLRAFDVPVLCMTATLPNDRREALRKCALKIEDDKPDDLKLVAGTPRYTLTHIGTRDHAIDRVRVALGKGRRVLWVTNTVRRCHEITALFVRDYHQMVTEVSAPGSRPCPVYCYHSRFKLTHRVDRHEDIVHALKAGQPAALGVTTQVCEMSLDLDVDLLVTEKCPVTSLIQRMGRCNRSRDVRPLDYAGEVLVYEPDNPAPYTADDLKGWDEFLKRTAGKELSQTCLETALSELKESPPWLGDTVVMFQESGAYAVGPKGDEDAVTFREGNDFNRPCLLPVEVEKYLGAEKRDQPGYIVPVPKKLALANDSAMLPKYLGIATDNHYHEMIGYCDRPLSEWGAK